MKKITVLNQVSSSTLTLSVLVCSALSSTAFAHDMVPATAQSSSIIFKNATVHTVIDGVKHNTNLLIQDGVIKAIGPEISAPEAQIFDASNKHIYPGLIALDTSMGLVEVEMMRPSNDSYDIGLSNPQLEAITAFNPDSEIIPTVRVNGITHAQVVPQGERLAGQSALVSMDSWTIEDALVPSTMGFHLYWPKQGALPQDEKKREKQLKQHRKDLKQLATIFEEGYRYSLASKAKKLSKQDIRWQSMLPLYRGDAQLFVHANRQKQIEEAVSLAKQYGFKLVIVGGYDAWRLGELLNEIEAKVIYTKTLSLPMRKDEPLEMSFKIPALLKQANIPFALGFTSDWNSRNLPLAAGQTVAYGLSKEDALQSITLDAAKILGAESMGALAPGYAANLVISGGDILDPMMTKIEKVYIDGREVDLNNRQQQLYQKYLKR
ncbi:amidohydrolase family protein [Shewanella nanhaiensis]|uniref:Amidohydrolase family protein n=1 Tax=Shewanella nanhaiensis TaxID=2864872 RepID=A0ABS7DYK6_9GAMM|nr:amidohydrolase family protein [Shewanella nanhaiensis]MBW8182434.1 amidohydrolase family protein [Shewanella nanhaiensis]